MKILNGEKKEVFSSDLRLDDEKRIVANVSLGEGMTFEAFPVGISTQGVDGGLEMKVEIPNSGLDPFYAVFEYSDMKVLKSLPGKGLVSFFLKALR